MESCIVCLESNEDVSSRITTLSFEWIDGKLQRIIEKHLWWWYMKPMSQSNGCVRWICRQCWLQVTSFHRFYGKVEKAHRYYKPIESILRKFDKNEKEQINVNTNKDLLMRRLGKHDNNIVNCKEKGSETDSVTTEFCFSSNVCENKKELVLGKSFNKRISNNEVQEGDPIVHGSEINDESAIGNRNTEVTLNTDVLKKSRRMNFKAQVDNFLRESQHKLECCICNVSLPDFRLLKAHYRSEHNTKGYAMCCGNKYFKRCLLYDHLKVHRDPNYFKCQMCTKTYATRRGFKAHLDTHKMRERKYNCEECGKSYFKLHIYERHKLMHLPESEKHFNCSQCSKKFASAYLRRQHEDSTHAKKYAKICEMCGKSFSHSYSFLRHMEEHAGIPPTLETCGICGAKLTNKKGLKQHMRMRHLEENLQEQICPYCARVSPNSNAHRKHVKYAHVMQRKHACHMCDKAFRRPLELKEHLSTHTGEALYKCPHCTRTFISHANMYKHRKIAHRKEWEESRLNKMNRNGYKSVASEMFAKVAAVENSTGNLLPPATGSVRNLNALQS